MKLTMLSHASVLVEQDTLALCTDPWFLGDAFNESWALLATPAITPRQLSNLSHIWISHEHPDHLHFPTLKAIPHEQRARVTLLYQEHFSSRMYRALDNLGFQRVVELPLSRWTSLNNDTSVLCCSSGTIDSLLAIRSKGVTVLNLNDCALSPGAARSIGKRIGPVDVLLTQFSISSWVGNSHETDPPARHNVIARIKSYVNAFHPKVLIPFASFVYFSHAENRYLNRWINTPDYVCAQLNDLPCRVQFLYNGDSWSTNRGFSFARDPLVRYQRDFGAIADRSFTSHPSYPLSEIITLGERLIKNVRRAFPTLILKMTAPIYFYIVDLDITIVVDIYQGLVRTAQRPKEDCDIALGSQALWYAFKFPWGFSTLEVSGRFELVNPKLNDRALYLCHLYCSDITFKGFWHRLGQARVWNFLWTKRYELADRLLRKKHPTHHSTDA